jgi:hypothetical protein
VSKFENSEVLKFYWLLSGILRAPKQFILVPEITYTFVASEEISVIFTQNHGKKDGSTHIHPLVSIIAMKNGHAFYNV